jgi:lipopolysaccharide/colanic/teichoic acid biosynthesis glycosyltransferase
MTKRLVDVLGSILALTLAGPMLVIVAVLIRAHDGGPVFYRGTRIGRGGRPFRIFKFRTMVVDAERIGGASTADDDPRITPIGRRLRKRKLDEFPQFINVLLGEMSLVGPRPEVPHYVAMFTEEERQILTVRPGMTDWASLWNSDEGAVLAGSADPERTYVEKIRPEKIRLQLLYVRKRSMRTDLSIVVWTAGVVMFGARPRIPGTRNLEPQ